MKFLKEVVPVVRRIQTSAVLVQQDATAQTTTCKTRDALDPAIVVTGVLVVALARASVFALRAGSVAR